MDKLLFSDWVSLLTAIGVMAALLSNLHNIENGKKAKAAEMAEIKADLKNIRASVARMEALTERLVVTEQSTKSAHKRINRLEGRDKLSI